MPTAYPGVELELCWALLIDSLLLVPPFPLPLIPPYGPSRSRVFETPCFLPRVLSTVKRATANGNAMGEDRTASPSLPCGSNSDLNQGHTHQQREGAPGTLVGATAPPHVLPEDRTQHFQLDTAFDAPPPQVSPDAAHTLRRVFTVLRNSCAGCPANNQALSYTGLAEAVRLLTVQQATHERSLVVIRPISGVQRGQLVLAERERESFS